MRRHIPFALGLSLLSLLLPAHPALADSLPATQPVAPAWMSKDPSQWPQILMTNKVTENDNRYGYSGSSSLFRLPNGIVLMGTAGHLLGDVKLADFKTGFKSWEAVSRASLNNGVLMTQVALPTDPPPALDLLVLCPRYQAEQWPTVVLPIRDQPLSLGDHVFLLTVPFDGKDHQDVFKGVVAAHIEDDQLKYDVDGDFKTTGSSGAPVIDEYGRLAAINVGHFINQTAQGKLQLTCIDITEVVKVLKIPPDVKPRPGSGPAVAGAADSPDDASQKANDALRNVQPYIDAKMYSQAALRLQDIIDKYPGTDAAKKAKQLLSQFPQQ